MLLFVGDDIISLLRITEVKTVLDKIYQNTNILLFIWSQTPRRVFEHYLVPLRPFSINGLLGDEAVAPLFLVLVDPVHPALLHAVLPVVMVGDQAAALLTAKYQK